MLHYHIWKIIPTYNKICSDDMIKKIIRGEQPGVFISRELEELLILYSHGTRREELIEINGKWNQINILTMIDFLSKNENYTKARKSYDDLCELIHPNIETNLIFSEIHYENDKITINSFKKEQNQNIKMFLELISYPLSISCEIIQTGIQNLKKVNITYS